MDRMRGRSGISEIPTEALIARRANWKRQVAAWSQQNFSGGSTHLEIPDQHVRCFAKITGSSAYPQPPKIEHVAAPVDVVHDEEMAPADLEVIRLGPLFVPERLALQLLP